MGEYVFVFVFDRQGPKVRTLKKWRDYVVPAFYTVDVPAVKVLDSELNWNIIVLPRAMQTVTLSDLYYYEKSNIDFNMSWQDLEDIL